MFKIEITDKNCDNKFFKIVGTLILIFGVLSFILSVFALIIYLLIFASLIEWVGAILIIFVLAWVYRIHQNNWNSNES